MEKTPTVRRTILYHRALMRRTKRLQKAGGLVDCANAVFKINDLGTWHNCCYYTVNCYLFIGAVSVKSPEFIIV